MPVSAPFGDRLIVGALVVVVATVVGVGIAMLGPPSEERARRLDDRRIDDLRRISLAAHLYNSRHQRLPASVAELSTEPGVMIDTADPVTREAYPYRVVDANRYELCATFDRQSSEARSSGFWSHGTGRQCFTLKADETK